MERIGFIGGGNMAQALINGIITAGVYTAENIFVSDVQQDRLSYLKEKYGITVAEGNGKLAGVVETLVLSVKPQNMADALQSIKDSINPDTVVISIAAGVKTTVLG